MNARTDLSSLALPEVYFATLPSGTRVPYVASGYGEPLLFIHGSLCDYRYWGSQASALSKQFFCMSVSLSHYWPDDQDRMPGEFGWRTHVEELADFIAMMQVGPVHLVGHSRGGCVAFHLAREYPHLVKTLTLADPGGPLQVAGMAEAQLPAATVALRARAAALIEEGDVDAGLELFVDSVSMPGAWGKSPAGFRRMAIDNAATLPKQFRDPLPAYTQADTAGLRCKLLLVEGERSPRMYRDNAAQLLAWHAGAEKRTIAGASHGMNVSHPAAFNRVIEGFVRAAAV
ncbi:alpha/beta hydrolase [Pseudoduganella sp. SL102]|uniref:alpha/beta fold hydrolase n=1 Tax=Pseudoduganella sp. SL102 TaxID=2995154 RepID=UPI00248AAD2B|nr:alpha/beta hydrolase [Pseudoduganella sp. SL102]WBS05210.1 alpha/beta hydrolase [Pseudoduganella sp. SL102]